MMNDKTKLVKYAKKKTTKQIVVVGPPIKRNKKFELMLTGRAI